MGRSSSAAGLGVVWSEDMVLFGQSGEEVVARVDELAQAGWLRDFWAVIIFPLSSTFFFVLFRWMVMAVWVEWLGGADQWWPNRRFLFAVVFCILNGIFLGSSVDFSCLSPFSN